MECTPDFSRPPAATSFFLFGARGTGKTTWMRDAFDPDASLYLDLLDPEVEDLYRRTPSRLEQQVRALPDSVGLDPD